MATAGSILMKLRAHDEHNFGIVTLLAHDATLARLIAAWPSVGRKLQSDASPLENTPAGLDVADHERWLWARVEPEPEPLWAEAAGLPDAEHVRRAMRVLMDNGAVFPDGDMSRWSERFLVESAKRAGVKQPTDEDAA
jgi:hypothetical protein